MKNISLFLLIHGYNQSFCFQGSFCLIHFFASDRPFKGRYISEICAEFEKSGRNQGEYRSRYVASGTEHHRGCYCRVSPHRYRILNRLQLHRDHMYIRVLRGDYQLHRVYDVLPGLSVSDNGGNYERIDKISIIIKSIL